MTANFKQKSHSVMDLQLLSQRDKL